MMEENIYTKTFDIFIAYHGDEVTGSLFYAEKIYELLRKLKVNGRPLEVFLQSKTNMAGQFSNTPLIAPNCKLFLLVATDKIPVEFNGTILQKDQNGFTKRLFQEVSAYAESTYYLKNPDKTTRIISVNDLDLDYASRLHYIFNGKNHFRYDDILAGKTAALYEWIQHTVGVFDLDEDVTPILNTTSLPFYSNFITRHKELNEIDERLEENNFLILSSEQKGIGVKTLAINYGKKYDKKYSYIHFVDSPTSIKELVLGLSFKGYEKYDFLPKDIQYVQKCELFNKLNKSTLVIVADMNFDYRNDEDFYNVIANSHCRILMTSSYSTKFYPNMMIEPMSNDDLLKLFRYYYEGNDEDFTDESLIEFFNNVNGHTSIITIVAQLLSKTDLELDEVLEKIFDSKVNIYLDKNKADANTHLLRVYDLSRHYLTEEEFRILSMLSLFDVSGVEVRKLEEILGIDSEIVEEIKGKGQVKIYSGKPRIVSIDKMLSNVIYHNYPPCEEDYLRAINLINAIINYDDYQSYSVEQHKTCCRYGEFIQTKRQLNNTKETIVMLNNMVSHYYAIAYLPEAKAVSDLALEMYKTIDADLNLLTQIYVRRAPVLEDTGLYRDSFKELSELMEIISDQVDLYYVAVIYNYMGALKRRMSEASLSLEYHQKAYDILKGLNQNDIKILHGLATALNDMGSSYEKLKDYETALEKKLLALEIREQILPADHPEIAKSYNNIGNSYNHVKEYNEALKCEEKALDIRKRIFPTMHPDIAKVYNNMGSTYRMMRDYENAIDCYDKAIAINSRLKGVAVTNLVFSLHKKALVYVEMKLYDEALKLLDEAYNLTSLKYHNSAAEVCEEMLNIYEILKNEEKIGLCVDRLIRLYTKLEKDNKVKLLTEKYGK